MTKRGENDGSIFQRKSWRWVAVVNQGWQNGKRVREPEAIPAATKAVCDAQVRAYAFLGSLLCCKTCKHAPQR
jgi:hypothetical protein